MPTIKGKDIQSLGQDTVAEKIIATEKEAATLAGKPYTKTKAEVLAIVVAKPVVEVIP